MITLLGISFLFLLALVFLALRRASTGKDFSIDVSVVSYNRAPLDFQESIRSLEDGLLITCQLPSEVLENYREQQEIKHKDFFASVQEKDKKRSCKYWSGISPSASQGYLKCAINPKESCLTCKHFEASSDQTSK